MSKRRLNEQHPYYALFKKLVDEAVDERMAEFHRLYEIHRKSDSPDKYGKLEAKMVPVDRKCGKRVNDLMKEIEHLYEPVEE